MKKKQVTGAIVVILLIIGSIALIVFKENTVNSIKKRIVNEITEIAISKGLKEVTVSIDEESEAPYHCVYVDCSNMEDLSFDEMFMLDDAMHEVENVHFVYYTSNKNEYNIFYDEILKNDETIYKDTYYYGSHKNNENKEIIYDAILEYSGTTGVLICISEDAMDRFMTAVNSGHEGTLQELFLDGQCAYTEQGTKCNIVDKKFTKAKVRLLDGAYAGNVVWVVIEALQEK